MSDPARAGKCAGRAREGVRDLRHALANQVPDGAWRVTAANEDYSLCPTYARVLAVPRSVDDASLRAGRE